MNAPEKSRRSTMSPEAVIGIGITVAELGVLSLLLGWAEYMRAVPAVAWIWLALGAALFVIGGIAAFSARPKDRGRIARVPDYSAQGEPEERLE
jgi:amino acid transporter